MSYWSWDFPCPNALCDRLNGLQAIAVYDLGNFGLFQII